MVILPPYPLMKKFRPDLAEIIGTFILAAAVGASGQTSVATPLVAGITLLTLVYVLGPVSGAHVNPAVTAGLWSIGAVKTPEALKYIVSQLIGGLLAYFALSSLSGLPMPTALLIDGSVGELLGAAILAMGVATVVKGKVADAAAGLAVGFSLFTGVLVASMGSPGVLNPAVALGLGAWQMEPVAIVVFVLMPLVGGVIGANMSKILQK